MVVRAGREGEWKGGTHAIMAVACSMSWESPVDMLRGAVRSRSEGEGRDGEEGVGEREASSGGMREARGERREARAQDPRSESE